jgi:hypothetical protein
MCFREVRYPLILLFKVTGVGDSETGWHAKDRFEDYFQGSHTGNGRRWMTGVNVFNGSGNAKRG